MIVFGMSGGGAQSAVMGASGDSALYRPYLESIGAAMSTGGGATNSDAVAGVMAWCPITSLDWANGAYEWNMGQFGTTGTRASGTWTEAYSGDLANAFAQYQNKLALRDSSGANLVLAKSSSGTYLAGSYYDHLVGVIQESLNDFLAVTTFPYTPSTMSGMSGMSGAPGGTGGAGGAPGGGAPSGAVPSGAGDPPSGAMPSGAGAGAGGASGGAPGGSASSSASTAYATVEAYIKHLNSDSTWVTYDSSTNKAAVLSLAGFVKSEKPATKASARSIMRGDTANTTEVNLALALGNYGINNVDFATIWGQGHTMAELTGSADANFISWVEKNFA